MRQAARWFAALGCAGALSLAGPAAPAAPREVSPMEFDESLAWLHREARRLIRACRRPMADGRAAFPPQVGLGYDAFWLRDYSYMLEACADAFTDQELIDACRLFAGALDAEGNGVDCIRFDGTPVYKPGFGTMGDNPVADGGPFTVNAAHAAWRRVGARLLTSDLLDALVRCLRATPRNPQTGLVHIRPDVPYDRCPYGFTDTVRKQGDVLFTSLLLVQSAGRLAAMLEAGGRAADAAEWHGVAARAAASCRTVFWDPEAGLFRAATDRCREHDLWGSAFAVFLGVAEPGQARAVAEALRRHYPGICQRGQFRHLLPGVVWEQACQPGTYQNGGFWATPAGWFVYTLDLVDPALARRTVVDLVADFQARGAAEWVLDDHVQLPGYVASATLPLQGIEAMLERSRQGLPADQQPAAPPR